MYHTSKSTPNIKKNPLTSKCSKNERPQFTFRRDHFLLQRLRSKMHIKVKIRKVKNQRRMRLRVFILGGLGIYGFAIEHFFCSNCISLIEVIVKPPIEDTHLAKSS